MSSGFQQELEVACDLAQRAGRAILDHYRPDVHVDYKGKGQSDPVTQADRDANDIIVTGLRQSFPDDAILAEESPASDKRHAHRRLWCVDPLDGTREFIDRNGQFVVMIGLAIHGEARLGVVYQPTENILYWGYDRHAFSVRGQESIRMSPTLTSDPSHAVLMVSRSHRSKTVTRVANELGVVREQPLGSVGLKATCVALGAADMYLSVSERTHEWDACAPEAILRAAGGMVTDCLGEPLRYNKTTTNTPRGILATNGLLHAACVQALQPIARERHWI